MANGASRIFNIIKSTNNENNNSSQLVTLKVKTLEPLTLTLDDRVTITKEFFILSDSINEAKLSVGDTLLATTYNDGQTYFIQEGVQTKNPIGGGGGGGSDIEVIDNLTSTDKKAALSANQGRVLNEKIENLETLPPGGVKGQVLTKKSSTNGDADWQFPGADDKEIFISNNQSTEIPPSKATLWITDDPQQAGVYNVLDTLESESTLDALSANQGRILNNKITNIQNNMLEYEVVDTW